jgi:hypothetical protein
MCNRKALWLVTVVASSAALFAVSAAVATAPASAEACFRTFEGLGEKPERGAYTNPGCNTAGPPKKYVWASTTFNWTATTLSNVYCVKVQAALPSWYEDSVCSKRKESTGEYSLVLARPGLLWGIRPAIKGEATTAQKLGTTAGPIECKEMSISGSAEGRETQTQILKVKYGGCEAFGGAVTVSEAEYEISARGTFSVVNKNVVVTDSSAACTVTVPAGGANSGLPDITYSNSAEGYFVAAVAVSGLAYEPSGGACGTNKLDTNGTYAGESRIEGESEAVEVALTPVYPGPGYFEGIDETPVSSPLAITASASGAQELESTTATVSCTALSISEAALEEEGKNKETITYTGCTTNKEGCTVRSTNGGEEPAGTIKTDALLSKLYYAEQKPAEKEEVGAKTDTVFQPASGESGQFTELKFSGSCGLAIGEHAVTGEVAVKNEPGETLARSHWIEAPSAVISSVYKAGGTKVSLVTFKVSGFASAKYVGKSNVESATEWGTSVP